jgi:hypothetical protein
MKIQIPQPCHEDWGKMTPNEQGRHCASCDKTVTDFTKMSDKQIAAFLLNSGSTCGRFSTYQLNRELVMHPTPQKHFGLLKVAACAVLSVNFFDSHGQNVPENFVEIQQVEHPLNGKDSEKPFNGIIKFKVIGTTEQLDSLAYIHFKINDFQIKFDSIEMEKVYEFHVPDSVLWNELIVNGFFFSQDTINLRVTKNEWIDNYQEANKVLDILVIRNFLTQEFKLDLSNKFDPEVFLRPYLICGREFISGNVIFGDVDWEIPEDISGLRSPQTVLHPTVIITNPEPENIKEDEDESQSSFHAHKAEIFQEKGSIWKTLYYLVLAGIVGFATNWSYKRRSKFKSHAKSNED